MDMKDEDKTQEQLISELAELRRQIAELEALDAERKQVEAALRESEEKFRSFTTNAPDFIVELNQNGTILFTNKTYEGVDREEVIGSSVYDWLPNDYRSIFGSTLKCAIGTGDSQFLEYPAPIPGGESRWYSASLGPIRVDDEVKSVVLITRDITKRKQAEEALQESEAKWKAISENSPAHVMLLDRDANILFINRTVPDLSREEVIGTSVYDYIPSGSREVASNSLAYVWLTDKPTSYTTEYITSAGEVQYFDVWLGPVFESGKVVALIGSSIDITDRKQAEEVLRKSEEKFRSLFDCVSDSLFIHDMGGRFLEVSRSVCEKLGYSREELLQMTPMDISSPEDVKLVPGRVEKLRQHGHILFEATLVPANGATFPAEINSQIIEYDGAPAILSSVRDITNRKQAEEALRESQNFLAKAQEIAEVGSWKWINQFDSEEVIWSDQTFRILGFAPNEIQPTFEWFLEVMHPDDVEPVAKGIEESMRTGEPYDMEYRLTRKDKKEIIVHSRGEVVLNQAGDAIGLIGVIHDITKRKRAEEELRKSEAKFRLYVQNAPDGIFVTDKEGRYLDVNPAASRLLGYSAEEFLTLSVSDITAPASLDEALKGFNELVRTGKVSGEYLFRHKDGHEFHMSVDAAQISTDLYIGFCSDITERKRMEEEMLKVEKLESIGVLAGGIAHDLNNLLTGVLGNISLARMYDNPAEKDRRLTEAEKASMRIKDLTQQLLTFSKGGAPILQTADIAALLRDSADFTLRGSNVRCDFSIPDDLWTVEVDAGQINQVVNNIVINAKQAMGDGGMIKIRAENTNIDSESGLSLNAGAYIKVSVEDRGMGIPAKQLHKIFDPFYTTKQEGSGLGLATSYSIIEKHNGHISVESQIGVGTTLHIYLPAFPEKVAEAGEQAEEKPIMGEGRVLVMDDEEIVGELATDMLSSLGYSVTTAIDGAETLATYKEAMESGNPFDAVIADLTIPGGMGGKETIQRLLDIDPEVKAIVSSGYSNDPVLANFREYGFKGVVAKPYKTMELSEVLHRVIAGVD